MNLNIDVLQLFGESTGLVMALLGAALAIGLAGTGSARATGELGEVAGNLAKERPETFGQAIVLQLLPGTQGLYGFVIGVLIIISIEPGLDAATGWQYFMAGLPIAITGLTSAPAQAKAGRGAFQILAKKPENVTQGIVFTAMVETYGILGFVGSILMLVLI